MPNDRAVQPELLERRIAAEIEALGLPTPTESELPLVDEIGGLGFAQLQTKALQNLAVTPPKIQPGTAGQVLLTDSNPSAAWTSLSGDVTVNSSGVTAIGSGVIVDADVNASAGIAYSKLANLTAGSVLLGNASNVPTATALSGDVTVNSSGVTAIGSGVIVNADVNASAGIQLTKLENVTAGRVVLGNASNVPTATALSGDVTVNSSGVTAIGSGVIVDADVNASAGIAYSKLANLTAGSVLLGNASNVPTATALSGDVTVNSSGVTAISAGSVVIADFSSAAGEMRGVWQTWTPTTGNISGANARTGYQLRIGRTFIFQITMTTGNTATAAAAITFQLPAGISATFTQILHARTSTNVALCTVSASTITMQANATGANFTAGQALGTVNIAGTILID